VRSYAVYTNDADVKKLGYVKAADRRMAGKAAAETFGGVSKDYFVCAAR
jgi:hypothetical protein